MVDDNILKVAKGARLIAGIAPGAFGQVTSVGLNVPISFMEESQRRAELAKLLARENLEAEASRNPALKRQLDDINRKTIDSIRNSAISATGAGLGALTGSAVGSFVPGPGNLIGGFIGSIVGGMAANTVDEAIFYVESNNAFAIKANIDEDIKKGIPVSEVKMFALLASSLPDKQLSSLNARLSTITNGEVTTLEQAVNKGKAKELQALMRAPGIDDLIRADTGLNLKFTDASEAKMTAAAEFAHMVNNGMDTSMLMRKDWRGKVVGIMNGVSNNIAYSQGVDVKEPDANPLPTMSDGSELIHTAGRNIPGGSHRKNSKHKSV